MNDKDYIKDLFSEKLGNYEAKVNPELWNAIASQVGVAGATAAGTAATGLSVAAKWIIGVSIAGALTVTAVLISNNNNEEKLAPVQESPTVNESATLSDKASEKALPAGDNTQTDPALAQLGGQTPTDNVELIFPGLDPIEAPSSEGNHSTANGGAGGPAPANKITEDRIINEITLRDPVHTPDPIVHEPLLPEEVAPEKEPDKSPEKEEKYFSVEALPNVFTPNNDGVNDHFFIGSENLSNFQVVVINAQNKVVFESSNPNFRWDGRDQSGNPVAEGNYVYYITATEFGTEKPKRYSPLYIKR